MSISFLEVFFAGVTLTVDLAYRSPCSATPTQSFGFIIFPFFNCLLPDLFASACQSS